MVEHIYLFGGEDVKNRSCYEFNKEIFSAKKEFSILVIPWTTENKEKRIKYEKIYLDYFKDLGAKNVFFLDEKESSDEIKRKFNVDFVYLPGGDTELLLEKIMKNKVVLDCIKNFQGTIIGNSAGALVLCKKVILTDDENLTKYKILKGLGLIDFSIEVHYTHERQELIDTISKKEKVIVLAIPENNYVKVSKKSVMCKGDICIFGML